jgi:sodium transport system ATP-binding protein
MIEVQQISKRFGPVSAVQEVSFAAPDGLITGLLGPNGAGKTTTMRIITGVLKPDQGTAVIDGYDTKTQSLDIQRRLGALPDNRGLYPRLTARENIRYYGQLHGLNPEVLEANINDLIALLDMHEIADRQTEGFSSGERVKVAIARALVHQPQNVILDEPTSGLDIMSTRAMRQFIRRLRDEGRCVLFSSHIMQEVAALCQYIVIVARGRVTAQGSPEDLRRVTGQANLEDAFVSLIGSGEGLE